jgi:uncharacterized protein YcnI
MSRRCRARHALCVLALAAVAPALAVTPAAAHMQVRPARAAPGDPVLWTVLVPSEEESGTRQLELAVPRGVLPPGDVPVPRIDSRACGPDRVEGDPDVSR